MPSKPRDCAISPSYNWSAAFLAYAQGASIEEISRVQAIPQATLEYVQQRDNWPALAARLPRSPEPHGEVKAQLNVIKANRQKNYEIACQLRDDLVDVVRRLRSTEGPPLTLEKQWHFRGTITRADVPLSISDRVQLATYAKLIADLSYRSLGDKDAAEGGAQDVPPSQSAPPSITIILPGLIAKPRKELSDKDLQDGITLDLSTETPTVTEVKSAKPVQTPIDAEVSAGG